MNGRIVKESIIEVVVIYGLLYVVVCVLKGGFGMKCMEVCGV